MKTFRKYLTESIRASDIRVQMANVGGSVEVSVYYPGEFTIEFRGQHGPTYSPTPEFTKAYKGSEADWQKWIGGEGKRIMDDIYKAANKFDQEVAAIMNKHGFRK